MTCCCSVLSKLYQCVWMMRLRQEVKGPVPVKATDSHPDVKYHTVTLRGLVHFK